MNFSIVKNCWSKNFEKIESINSHIFILVFWMWEYRWYIKWKCDKCSNLSMDSVHKLCILVDGLFLRMWWCNIFKKFILTAAHCNQFYWFGSYYIKPGSDQVPPSRKITPPIDRESSLESHLWIIVFPFSKWFVSFDKYSNIHQALLIPI